MNLVKDLYNYRELLKTNIKKDVGGKYKNSVLGVLWSFINPLLQIAVYALVFQVILKSDIDNYTVYLCCGLIPWQYFSSVVLRGAATIIDNGNIIKKVYFPREILPISIVGSNLVNFIISCLIIFLFLIFSGIGFSPYILFLPLIILVQTIFQMGIVFITSAINVYVRDAEYIINFILNMVFYATPILYSSSLFPEKIAWLLNLNPMTTIINCYRDILYYQSMPHLKSLLVVLAASLVLLWIGIKIFKKLEKGFAEEV